MKLKLCIYFFIVVMGYSTKIIAQKQVIKKANYETSMELQKLETTLLPNSMLDTACSNHLTYYSAGAAGYVTGNNSFGDIEKAQRYNGTGTVSEVLVLVITKTPASTQNTNVKLYSVNATTLAPDTVLGSSNAVTINAFDTAGLDGLTPYFFASPIAVTTNFYASFVLPAADTAIVVSTNSTLCNSTDSCAWELSGPAPNTEWHSIVTAWHNGGVGLAIDLAIFPVLTTTANIRDDYFIDGIILGQNQPNPASINTLVEYEIHDAASVSLEIYDRTGKLVMRYDKGKQSAGKHNINVDSEKLTKGTYYYSLKADDKRLTKRMIVTK